MPTMSACMPPMVAILVLTYMTTPVLADFAMYQKFGQQASQMQTWKQNFQHYLTNVENLFADVAVDVAGLDHFVKGTYTDMDQLVDVLNRSADDVLERLEKLQDNFTYPESYVPPYVVFQAKLEASKSNPLESSTITFKYTDVELNEGDHYSSSTGLFTAPVDGLYWLHGTFKTVGFLLKVAVMKKTLVGGGTEVIGFLRFHHGFEGTCTTMHMLKAGDTVGIYPKTDSFDHWSLGTGEANSFSGYIVAEYSMPAAPASIPDATTPSGANATDDSSTIS